jgi:hypothetical protein
VLLGERSARSTNKTSRWIPTARHRVTSGGGLSGIWFWRYLMRACIASNNHHQGEQVAAGRHVSPCGLAGRTNELQ